MRSTWDGYKGQLNETTLRQAEMNCVDDRLQIMKDLLFHGVIYKYLASYLHGRKNQVDGECCRLSSVIHINISAL